MSSANLVGEAQEVGEANLNGKSVDENREQSSSYLTSFMINGSRIALCFLIRIAYVILFAPVVALAWFFYLLHAKPAMNASKNRKNKPSRMKPTKIRNTAGQDRLEPPQIGML